MKKLFEMYQNQTFWFLVMFLFGGAKLTTLVGNQFGLVPALIVGTPIFCFSVLTAAVCTLWLISDWEVPRKWAMYSVTIASMFSTVMMATVLVSAFADMRWLFTLLGNDVHMIIGLLSLSAYAVDRIQHAREHSP